MYLLSITAGLVAAYLILFAFFPYFFTGTVVRLPKRSFVSVALIVVLSICGYAVVLHTRDLELGNRILHAFGGGFIAFMICFLAVKDAKVQLTRFQFCVMAALIVTGLGVANEILEFFLQHWTAFVFMRSNDDTWLDLLSNTVGIIIGAAAFVPFI